MTQLTIIECLNHVEKSMDDILAQLQRVDTHLIPVLEDFLNDYRHHLDTLDIFPKSPAQQATAPSPTTVPATPPTQSIPPPTITTTPPQARATPPLTNHTVTHDWIQVVETSNPQATPTPPSRTPSPPSPYPDFAPLSKITPLRPSPASYLHPITNYHHNITSF